MGASIGLMYASLRPNHIFAMVLDTPFRSLKKVMNNVAEHISNGQVPRFLIALALFLV